MFQAFANAEKRAMNNEDSVLNNPWSSNKRVPKEAADEARQLLEAANEVLDYDVVIVGAGAAGIGVAHALLKGGLSPSQICILERKGHIGASFREWHETTRFITPSVPAFPYGTQDLNAVVPDTTVHIPSHSHYPTGNEYADYLEGLMESVEVVVNFHQRVTSIESRQDQKFDVVVSNDSRSTRTITCANIVWCGGEWDFPRRTAMFDIPKHENEKNCTVHYKDVVMSELLFSAGNNDDPIVLVGGGEAGADLACGLVQQNASSRVLIIEQSSAPNDAQSQQVLDPSRSRLSPVTLERLERVGGDRIEYWTGTRCIGIHREATDVTKICAQLLRTRAIQGGTNETTSLTVHTRSKVVLCTGFDPSTNPILEEWFDWTEDGTPLLTPETDQSTEVKGLFLAGPSVVHNTGKDLELTTMDFDDEFTEVERDKNQDIGFSFVYKYRTRFPIIACEIIRRVLKDRHFKPQWSHITREMRLVLTPEGQKLFHRCKRMRDFYRSKGMLLEDLTCEDLACGTDELKCNQLHNTVDDGNYDTDETETAEQEDPYHDDHPTTDGNTTEGTEDSHDVW